MKKALLLSIGGLVLGSIANAFAVGVVNENSQAYVSCRVSVGNAYEKFLNQGACKPVTQCINTELNKYGHADNILIDAMVKCGGTPCRMAIAKYDYSDRLLRCVQNYKK